MRFKKEELKLDKNKKVKNYDKVVELAKQKSEQREEEVLKAISEMKLKNKSISFYSVQKNTGASRSYLYGNEKIRAKIENEREFKKATKKTDNSKDVIIKTLKMEIQELKRDSKYKKMYEDLLLENEELKEKLNAMYVEYYNE